MIRISLVALTFLVVCPVVADNNFRGESEYRLLITHLMDTCEVVRANPAIFPYRTFTFGPLGLEVRKASNATEANELRNLHLGATAHAYRLQAERITDYFFCGPLCSPSRKAHLIRQPERFRTLAQRFTEIDGLQLLSVWAPKDEVRVNDLFVLSGTAKEAIPSAEMGFVPSGVWKKWPSLTAYLDSIAVTEAQIDTLTAEMRDIGLSALRREKEGIRLVGVGVGDNESGVLLLKAGANRPKLSQPLADLKQLSILDRVADDLYYYETN
ncbi:hypothetical protein [Rheinheimera sp.]|uniref:hypothetical protein n=1 Tax=Rheinheimera sp. TaxID=1869214 RepID=UPI003AF7AC26